MSTFTINYLLGISVVIVFCVLFYYFIDRYNNRRIKRENEEAAKWVKSFRWNEDLANRFVSDYKLPISITNDENIFIYQLHLYEDGWHALTLWNNLWQMIDERYDGSAGQFLDDYYQIRERIIKETSESAAYKKFNEMDMKEFAVTNRPKVSKKDIYNGESIDKTFISVDLKKANFQALRFVDPEIVRHTDSYEAFIGTFTDLNYVKTSKYTRQVIFGKLNPSRHISVEQFIINDIWRYLKETSVYKRFFNDDTIVSMSNDEIVVQVPDDFEDATVLCLDEFVNDNLGLNVHTEVFKLECWQLKSKKNGHTRVTFFVKKFLDGRPDKLMCVPNPYHAIIWKLYNGREVNIYDRHFVYEKVDCLFNEDFELVQLSKDDYSHQQKKKKEETEQQKGE